MWDTQNNLWKSLSIFIGYTDSLVFFQREKFAKHSQCQVEH